MNFKLAQVLLGMKVYNRICHVGENTETQLNIVPIVENLRHHGCGATGEIDIALSVVMQQIPTC